jgi:hypothetical protein
LPRVSIIQAFGMVAELGYSMRSFRNGLIAAGFFALALGTTVASAASITVLGTADIFLAGGGLPSPDFAGDPSNYGGPGAGSLPPSVSVFAGETLTISATGLVSCCYGPLVGGVGPFANGPNGGGYAGPQADNISGYGNVGPYTGTSMALVGVFNKGSPWPTFEIGASDIVVVPVGATTLYLGIADALGFVGTPGWYNDNSGSFNVQVSATPLPAALPLFAGGLGVIGLFCGRRKQKNASAIAA